MVKLVHVNIKAAVAAVDQNAKRAAARIRSNLCAPVVARSNERSLARALAAKQKDLAVCIADSKANEVYFFYFALVAVSCLLLILVVSWTKNRRGRRDFEHRLGQLDLVIKELRDKTTRQAGTHPISHTCTNGTTQASTHLPSHINGITHPLQDYAAEIDDCIQQ